MALSGLERTLKETFKGQKVNFVGYADDFIITCKSRELLEQKVIPVVKDFMKLRGLDISEKKSKITHIDDGFDFLGHTLRKYNGSLLTKPSKGNIKAFLMEIRTIIRSSQSRKAEDLIKWLNPKIIGWANFFRFVGASRTFSYVDKEIYEALQLWMKRRHPNRRKIWRNKKYFRKSGFRNWQFSAKVKGKGGSPKHIDLANAKSIRIKRYLKIQGAASPYDPDFKEYFEKRVKSGKVRSSKR